MATAAVTATVASSSFTPSSSSPSRDLLVSMPELHLGTLQDLQLNDFATQQQQQPSVRYPATTPEVPASPSPYAMSALVADGAAHATGGPNTPVSAASSSQAQTQPKYSGLPPGAAPPAPGGGGLLPAELGTSSSPPPALDRRMSSSDPLLPTPPPSHQQTGQGPRHPGAAQAAAQSALPGAPRPRAAFAPAPTYPSIVTPLSLQGLIASESPPTVAAVARKKPEEEVCIECMMRDRDMADVDVTSPGVWTRASDAEYEDLLRRELEDEATTTASSSSHASRPRPRARGTAKLTEENVRKWVLMHPKDHEARWRTITKYVKAQSVLLEQEFAARARNEAETRSLDAVARDRYAQLQRTSGGEQSFVEPATGVRGVRVPSGSSPQTPTAQQTQAQSYFVTQPETHDAETGSIPASPGRILARKEKEQQDRERDVVLLENGLMLERVDLRRERSAGRARSVSLDKRQGVDDRLSVYSTPIPRTGPVPTEGVPGGRRAMPRAQSQMSGDRRSLFSGLRSSLAGSMVSLAASRASVVNLHGQNFDREPMPGRAISPSMPTLNDLQHAEWPGIENLPAPPGVPASVGSDSGGKKKKRGALGKLLKFFGSSSNSSSKGRVSTDSTARPSHTTTPSTVDDLSAPLAPPPSLAYLVSRKSGDLPAGNQQQHQRQQSSTSLVGTGPSPPTAPSSILPSPTSNRFSWRASSASLDVVVPQNGHHNGAYVDFPAPMQKHLDTLPEAFDVGQRTRRDTTASSATRPHTLFLTDKSLPPLPPEAYALAQPRPATAPGIRERERRQSFAGIPTQPVGAHARATTEFGEEDAGRRKSRFGLATLLGGKRKSSHQLRSASTSRALSTVVQDPQFVAYRYLGGDDAVSRQ